MQIVGMCNTHVLQWTGTLHCGNGNSEKTIWVPNPPSPSPIQWPSDPLPADRLNSVQTPNEVGDRPTGVRNLQLDNPRQKLG